MSLFTRWTQLRHSEEKLPSWSGANSRSSAYTTRASKSLDQSDFDI